MVKSIGTVCDYAKAPKMIRKKDWRKQGKKGIIKEDKMDEMKS
jgi:NDP-sugar pyrophosphorylase family protein